MRADISRPPDMLKVTKGVDAVVHFGGQAGEHDWESETYAAEILKREGPPGTSPADIFQRGSHCMSEGGTRSRLAAAPGKRPGTKRAAPRSRAR